MFVLALVLVTVIGYLLLKWQYSYWIRKGVYQLKPNFFYGNLKDVIFGKISFSLVFQQFYNELKSKGMKHGGVYELLTPTYIPVDLQIVKNIMQNDFNHFMDHGTYVNEESDPLTNHLFYLGGEKWKKLRAKLTPAFTTGKTKMLFDATLHTAKNLNGILKQSAELHEPVNMEDMATRMTTDVVGSAVFGIDCDSLKDPHSPYREFHARAFRYSVWGIIKNLISRLLPINLLKKVGFRTIEKDVEDFVVEVVTSTINYREQNNVHRKDLMHMLIQLKNTGKVSDNDCGDMGKRKINKEGQFLTLNEIFAQCFLFFLAGYETTSSAITFALLELAENPDIQSKLRNEIFTVLQNYDNEITFEAVKDMTYLEKVVYETLRKHSPAAVIYRVCTSNYQVPNSNVIIKKGDRVLISVAGIHKDPDYYPEPEIFNPERFNEENVRKRDQFTFLPFGEGPRICIGSKFALALVKVTLLTIIKDFSITVNEKTKYPIQYRTNCLTPSVKGDLWLDVHSLE